MRERVGDEAVRVCGYGHVGNYPSGISSSVK